MDNIKQCELCFKEYDTDKSDIENPNVFLYEIDGIKEDLEFCSIDCMEKVILKRLEKVDIIAQD